MLPQGLGGKRGGTSEIWGLSSSPSSFARYKSSPGRRYQTYDTEFCAHMVCVPYRVSGLGSGKASQRRWQVAVLMDFIKENPPPSYHINQPKLVVWYMDVSWQHKWFFHLSQAALKFDLLAAKYLANKNVMIGTQDIIYRYHICIEWGGIIYGTWIILSPYFFTQYHSHILSLEREKFLCASDQAICRAPVTTSCMGGIVTNTTVDFTFTKTGFHFRIVRH